MLNKPATSAAATHSPALLGAVIESAPTAMVMTDAAGRIVLVNAETEHLFGFPRGELLGQPVEMLLPERFRETHPAFRISFFVNPHGRPIGAGRDLFGLRRDGSEIPIEISLKSIKADDKPFVLSAIVDISERKRLEERFQLLIADVTEYAIIMLDPGGHVVSWNKGAERLKGYKAEEIIGRHSECFYTPEAIAKKIPQQELELAKKQGQLEKEEWRVRKDGSRFWGGMLLTALKDKAGNVEGFSKITRDLTERMRQEQRLRATVEAAPTAMIMLNPSGRIVLTNKEAERLFGYASAELLNRPVEILVPPRFGTGHAELRTGFFTAPNARRMGAGRDLYGLHKDGSEFPVEIGLHPVETDEGLFVLGAIVDISERKRLEALQRELHDELERRVKERTEELARSNDALEKSNVELQQFAYIASHDLQAPLRGIIGFSQLLQQNYQGRLDADAEKLITRIRDGVTRMQTLIDDLLAYARVESRSRPFEPCDLNEILGEVVNLLDSSISDSHAQVTRDDLPIVTGDRPQLIQMFQNLIGNSIKYHGPQPLRIHIAAAHLGDEWDISVRDNGIGIDKKHHERVFEIFRRLHTAQAYPGTGIGLAICRRIATRHGGKIWIESTPGQGSTFHFTIKTADKAASE